MLVTDSDSLSNFGGAELVSSPRRLLKILEF